MRSEDYRTKAYEYHKKIKEIYNINNNVKLQLENEIVRFSNKLKSVNSRLFDSISEKNHYQKKVILNFIINKI